MSGGDAERRIELASTPKLRRAQAHFAQYLNDARQWAESGGAAKRRVSVGRVEFEFPPAPEELVALVGDCIQDMRSALDHEIYRIAAERHGSSWSGLTESAFPIVARPGDLGSKGVRRQIRGLSEAERDFVRSAQQFAEPPDRAAHILYVLNRLARVDRHRALHVAAMQPTSVTYDAPVWAEGHALPRLPVSLNCEIRFVEDDVGPVANVHELLGNGLMAVADTIARLRRVEGDLSVGDLPE